MIHLFHSYTDWEYLNTENRQLLDYKYTNLFSEPKAIGSIKIFKERAACKKCGKIKQRITTTVPKGIQNTIKRLRDEFLDKKLYFILPEAQRKQPRYADINNGFCYLFAESVYKEVRGSKIEEKTIRGVPHAFIKYKNRYYDAESPGGVSKLTDLQLFQYATLSIEDRRIEDKK